MFLIHLPSLKFKVLYARIRMEKAIIHLHLIDNTSWENGWDRIGKGEKYVFS